MYICTKQQLKCHELKLQPPSITFHTSPHEMIENCIIEASQFICDILPQIKFRDPKYSNEWHDEIVTIEQICNNLIVLHDDIEIDAYYYNYSRSDGEYKIYILREREPLSLIHIHIFECKLAREPRPTYYDFIIFWTIVPTSIPVVANTPTTSTMD